MFDVPVDAWYTWLGVAAASVLLVGVAVSLPTSPPPAATEVADAIDRVAVADHGASVSVSLAAASVSLTPHAVALRNEVGDAHATFAFGPVTPVGDDPRLARVAAGDAPAAVFDTPAHFETASRQARRAASRSTGPRSWQEVSGPLRARRVTWDDVTVTLVGVGV